MKKALPPRPDVIPQTETSGEKIPPRLPPTAVGAATQPPPKDDRLPLFDPRDKRKNPEPEEMNDQIQHPTLEADKNPSYESPLKSEKSKIDPNTNFGEAVPVIYHQESNPGPLASVTLLPSNSVNILPNPKLNTPVLIGLSFMALAFFLYRKIKSKFFPKNNSK